MRVSGLNIKDSERVGSNVMLDEGKVGDDGKILVVVLGSDEDIVACGMS